MNNKYFFKKGISMDRYNWFVYKEGSNQAIALCRNKSDARLVCDALNKNIQDDEQKTGDETGE